MKAFCKEYWRDCGAFLSIVALTWISVDVGYNLGMLVGFLVIFVFFYFERIRKLIVEFNVRKIFGIELGEYEREVLMESVRDTIKEQSITHPDQPSDFVATSPLYKTLYPQAAKYEEEIARTLRELDLPFRSNVGLHEGTSPPALYIDFVVDIGSSKKIGIETSYLRHQTYTSKNKLNQLAYFVEKWKQEGDLIRCFFVTNTHTNPNLKTEIEKIEPLITIVDDADFETVSAKIKPHLTNLLR